MPNRTCTIHGQYDETYAICPKCAGAAGDSPTIGPTGAGVPTDLETMPPESASARELTAQAQFHRGAAEAPELAQLWKACRKRACLAG